MGPAVPHAVRIESRLRVVSVRPSFMMMARLLHAKIAIIVVLFALMLQPAPLATRLRPSESQPVLPHIVFARKDIIM